MESKTLQQAVSDFWNHGYADYDLSTSDKSFDKLDNQVVETIFSAGWAEAKKESYTRTEVENIMKRLLHDAAERAEIDYYDWDKCRVDKESITNINIETYLTK